MRIRIRNIAFRSHTIVTVQGHSSKEINSDKTDIKTGQTNWIIMQVPGTRNFTVPESRACTNLNKCCPSTLMRVLVLWACSSFSSFCFINLTTWKYKKMCWLSKIGKTGNGRSFSKKHFTYLVPKGQKRMSPVKTMTSFFTAVPTLFLTNAVIACYLSPSALQIRYRKSNVNPDPGRKLGCKKNMLHLLNFCFHN